MASRASGWKDLADAASIKTDTTEGDTNDLLTGGTEPPKGCWHTFSRCIGGNNQNLKFLHFVVYTHLSGLFLGMWASREMDTSRDREIYVRTTIRELVVYIIFLTVLCICKYMLDKLFFVRTRKKLKRAKTQENGNSRKKLKLKKKYPFSGIL